MNHDKDLPRVYKALSAPEQAELQRENEELKKRVDELEKWVDSVSCLLNGPGSDEAADALGWYLDKVEELLK